MPKCMCRVQSKSTAEGGARKRRVTLAAAVVEERWRRRTGDMNLLLIERLLGVLFETSLLGVLACG